VATAAAPAVAGTRERTIPTVSDEVRDARGEDARTSLARIEHDLNNSLASIVAFGQLIRSDPDLPSSLRSQAELLVQEAKRTRQLVGNLVEAARHEPVLVQPSPADPDPPSDPDPARTDERPRILVLDDEPSIRDFLGRALTRAGFEPILTASGPDALDLIRSDPPAAILCDHRMAGMSGTEFQAAVAEIDPGLGRRFAFMTGDVLNHDLREFATTHGVHLLAKPFDIASVGDTVRALLTTPAG
jgi:two-component system, cell cycle response regulator CpdR